LGSIYLSIFAGDSDSVHFGGPSCPIHSIAKFGFQLAARLCFVSPSSPWQVPIVNVSLLRNIRIVEGTTLQLRAEAYNALNRTNLSGPNTTVLNTNFGVISGNGDPRKMQIAAKFTF
jgi:hypothetical protein